MNLMEVFTSIYSPTIVTHNRDTIEMEFVSSAGNVYVTLFERINFLSNPRLGNNNSWVFSFYLVDLSTDELVDRGPDSKFNEPDVITVLSTVLSIMKRCIYMTSADVVVFISVDEGLSKTYNRILKRVSPPNGYMARFVNRRVDTWVLAKTGIPEEEVLRISDAITRKNYGFK